MRIEPLKHSFKRAVDEILLIHVPDIVLFHHVENLTEAFQCVIIGIRTACAHHTSSGKKKDQSQRTCG